MSQFVHSVFLLSLTQVMLMSLSAAGEGDLGLHDWTTVARCRALCFDTFIPVPQSDQACVESEGCFQCWGQCDSLYKHPDIKAFCSDPPADVDYYDPKYCQHEGCEVACQFYLEPDAVRSTEDQGLWRFPASPAIIPVRTDLLQILWERPVPVDPATLSTPASEHTIVYAMFVKSAKSPQWFKISMTSNLRTTAEGDHENVQDLQFLLLACSVQGVIGRANPLYPGSESEPEVYVPAPTTTKPSDNIHKPSVYGDHQEPPAVYHAPSTDYYSQPDSDKQKQPPPYKAPSAYDYDPAASYDYSDPIVSPESEEDSRSGGLPITWNQDSDYSYYEALEEEEPDNSFLEMFGPPPEPTTQSTTTPRMTTTISTTTTSTPLPTQPPTEPQTQPPMHPPTYPPTYPPAAPDAATPYPVEMSHTPAGPHYPAVHYPRGPYPAEQYPVSEMPGFQMFPTASSEEDNEMLMTVVVSGCVSFAVGFLVTATIQLCRSRIAANNKRRHIPDYATSLSQLPLLGLHQSPWMSAEHLAHLRLPPSSLSPWITADQFDNSHLSHPGPTATSSPEHPTTQPLTDQQYVPMDGAPPVPPRPDLLDPLEYTMLDMSTLGPADPAWYAELNPAMFEDYDVTAAGLPDPATLPPPPEHLLRPLSSYGQALYTPPGPRLAARRTQQHAPRQLHSQKDDPQSPYCSMQEVVNPAAGSKPSRISMGIPAALQQRHLTLTANTCDLVLDSDAEDQTERDNLIRNPPDDLELTLEWDESCEFNGELTFRSGSEVPTPK